MEYQPKPFFVYHKSMKLTTLFIPGLILLMLLAVGCEYYRVDPATGKRYEITRSQYQDGIREGERNDNW